MQIGPPTEGTSTRGTLLRGPVLVVSERAGTHMGKPIYAEVEAAGLKPSFPIFERAPYTFEVGSQAVMDRLSEEHGVEIGTLPFLRYHNEGMLPRYAKMFMELKRLKGAEWNGEL
jgi:hypothetical protein